MRPRATKNRSIRSRSMMSRRTAHFSGSGGKGYGRRFSFALLSICAFTAAGCDSGFQTVGEGEHAVVFSAVPPILGGGVKDKVLVPGEKEFLMPWESLYRLDTTLQSIAWGAVGEGDRPDASDYVETRSLEGNEVGVAVTLQYRVDPQKLAYVVQRVGATNEAVRRVVAAIGRTDVRTHLNTLRNDGFFNIKLRDAAVDRVMAAMDHRLRPEGIIVDAVLFQNYEFARRLKDGTYNREYQDQFEETNAKDQETAAEEKYIKTVAEKKQREYNEKQAVVNTLINRAEGYKRQAERRGMGYLTQKTNEAERIKIIGEAEVESMRKEISALAGPGGIALLRLEIARQMVERRPSFILLNSGEAKNGSLELNRVDTNELIRQLGLVDAAAESRKAPAPSSNSVEKRAKFGDGQSTDSSADEPTATSSNQPERKP